MRSRIESVIHCEKEAIETLLSMDMNQYKTIAEEIDECKGKVIFMGVGKSAHIGQKLAATFASLGIPSFFVHSTESMHGDLGMIECDDIVILMSNSGETKEVLQTIEPLHKIGSKLIAFTGSQDSNLAKKCDRVLLYPKPVEADVNNLAPTSSTTMMLVLGDAIACEISEKRKFSRNDFHKFHPGGKLGASLEQEKER